MQTNALVYFCAGVSLWEKTLGASFTQGKCYPLKGGEGRDIGASAGVMDTGWEGGGSSSAHCSCAKARGWGQRGPENMTSQWKKKKNHQIPSQSGMI